jgi:ribosomal-protein-alanine N-acetyltransferase
MFADAQTELFTPRLILRPFAADDAATVQELAGNAAIADTTLNIPHPYEDGMAETWIGTHKDQWKSGKGVVFAVTLRESRELIGAIGIVRKLHDRGEMGYWIGQHYWNQGYATEASRSIIGFGFDELEFNKISASHLVQNPASGRVMEKIGMQYEGFSPQHVKKSGQYMDLKFYGILREVFIEGNQ